jgi:hypothetical protein
MINQIQFNFHIRLFRIIVIFLGLNDIIYEITKK